MEQALEGADAVHRVKRGPKPKVAAIEATVTNDAAQAYAMRVWGGQSVDVPPAERKERVMAALRGQNMPTDGITFPA
jgi:hypothetical protein